MYLLILFLIILLIILIYNNSKSQYIENYIPKDYSRSIDVRLCKEESTDILTPKYDREFNLNELQEIIKESNNDDKIIVRKDNDDNLGKKVSKNANKKNTRRETKVQLDSFKYNIGSDEMYDMIDEMED